MANSSARERIKNQMQGESLGTLLMVALAITVIITLFEWKLDAMAMLREFVSNFITCVSITFVTAILTCAVGRVRLGRDWWRLLLLVALLAAGGMLGGLISWGINDLLFSIRMTHPWIYMVIVATVTVIFGVGIIAYQNISDRLEVTASRLAEKEVQEQKLLSLKTAAELEALRAKVNPHFLFNTLNSIASLIPTDPQTAEEVVQRLSNLFRYVLVASDRGLVPLSEELNIVGEYLAIEKIRLGSRLDYTIEGADAVDGVTIPGMLLQPLVENSVKYGIVPDKRGGKIGVRCSRNGNGCTITISDTGEGFDVEAAEEGFGISGVRQRLELNYPGSHAFEISSDNGVTIRITIPVTDDV